jgi:hypothetical protein
MRSLINYRDAFKEKQLKIGIDCTIEVYKSGGLYLSFINVAQDEILSKFSIMCSATTTNNFQMAFINEAA